MDVAPIDRAREALTKSQLRIFDFVWSHPGRDIHALVAHQWADDPDGGPLGAGESIRSLIVRANIRLVAHRMRIKASKIGAGAVYFVTVE